MQHLVDHAQQAIGSYVIVAEDGEEVTGEVLADYAEKAKLPFLGYASVAEARAGIGNYFTFYNTKRPHQALDGKTPDAAYSNPLQLPAAA